MDLRVICPKFFGKPVELIKKLKWNPENFPRSFVDEKVSNSKRFFLSKGVLSKNFSQRDLLY